MLELDRAHWLLPRIDVVGAVFKEPTLALTGKPSIRPKPPAWPEGFTPLTQVRVRPRWRSFRHRDEPLGVDIADGTIA